MKTSAPRRIVVDFTRYGHATTITTRLFPEERVGLHVGQRFIVEGDDVAPRNARVKRIHPDGRQVDLEILPA